MSAVFSADGFRRLRAAWILLGLCVAAVVALGIGGRWYLEMDRRDAVSSAQRLREAQTRLDAVRRERDSLKASEEVFRALVARGVLSDERRLDMIELVTELRSRYRIAGLEYEISPQRALPGVAFSAVDVLGTRVRFKLRALHEGDALGFLDDLARTTQGLYPIDRCVLRRTDANSVVEGAAPRVEAECQMEWITVLEKNRAPRPG